MPAAQFDKDFGYLIPFLDKVAEAAKGMADTGARDELTRLMAEEKTRWARIRQLLSGSGATASGFPGKAEPVTARGDQPAPGSEGFSFTVGSLRKRQ